MDDVRREEFLSTVRDEAPLLRFAGFDRTSARELGAAVAASCERDGLPITVAVHLGEQRVFHVAYEGTTAENDRWVQRKRNTVLRAGVSSFEVALTTRLAGEALGEYADEEFAAASGAVPVYDGDLVVGTVALSGLVESEEADHEAVMRGIVEYRRRAGLATEGAA